MRNESPDYGGGYLLHRVVEWRTLRHKSSQSAVAAIKQSSDNLEFQVYVRGSANLEDSISFSRKKGDYKCDSGWIVLKSTEDPTKPTTEEIAIGWSSVGLAKSKDGFVVVKESGGVVGLDPYSAFPVAASVTNWYRFKPLSHGDVPELRNSVPSGL